MLTGVDVVFVVAQNSGVLGQDACGSAMGSLTFQLSQPNTYGVINTENDLKNAIEGAITYAYKYADKTDYLAYPGMTMTIGYFYIGNDNKPYSGSRTMSVIDGTLQVPTTQYTFTNPGGQTEYLGAEVGREPAYYYGSGTKPITASLTVNAISKAWRYSNPNGTAEQFMSWYRGTGLINGIYSSYGAVNMSGLLQMATQSYYNETLQKYTDNRDPQNIGTPTFTTSTKTIQDWYSTIYTNDQESACSWKGLSQEQEKCNTNMCYEGTNQGICSCITITNIGDIFMNNLTPISMINMRGGVPDADTIATSPKGLVPSTGAQQLDYIDQVIGRTTPIGPMNYSRGLVGFNWVPGWNSNNSPITPGISNGYNPPAQYSSSGFTLLGTILWILDPNGPKSKDVAVDWSKIDINKSFLPKALQNNNNYAGTSGNGGSVYFVTKGGQPQKGILPGCNIANEFRQDCIGPGGSDAKTCLASGNGCCYQPNIVVVDGKHTPWCFKKQQ
jgi:hypothetical protein